MMRLSLVLVAACVTLLQPAVAAEPEPCGLSQAVRTNLAEYGKLSHDCVLLPGETITIKPATDVPMQCSSFLGSWGDGMWTAPGQRDGRPHRLTVVEVSSRNNKNGQCDTRLIYSWGADPNRAVKIGGNTPGYLVRQDGSHFIEGIIEGNALSITDPAFAAFFSIVLDSVSVIYEVVDEELRGTFSANLRDDGRQLKRTTRLTKAPPLFFPES